MRHKIIVNTITRIRNKKQLVIIYLENNECVFISPSNIFQNTSLEIFEIELLIGSAMRFDFYKNGELMFNGKVCNRDNSIIKEYFIELQKPVERLRIENSNQLLGYKSIKNIFCFDKFGRSNVGIVAEDDSVTFMPLKRLEIQSNIDKSELHILIGSYILPEYYKKGDVLPNQTIVSENNKILRWINLRYSDKIENMHKSFEENLGYYNRDLDYNGDDDLPRAYGYSSWSEMALYEAFEGDIGSWKRHKW